MLNGKIEVVNNFEFRILNFESRLNALIFKTNYIVNVLK